MGWHHGDLLAFDVETTGVNVETDRIVSASLVLIDRDRSVISKTWIVNPGVPIPEEASRINGLTTEFVIERGQSPEMVIPIVVDDLSTCDCPIVVFNASFDLTILDRELRRLSKRPNLWLEGKEFKPIIDPFTIDRHVDPYRKGKRTLTALCEHYGVKSFEGHRSHDDALATARLAWKMASVIPELAEQHPNELHEQQKLWYKTQAESLRAYFSGLALQQTDKVEKNKLTIKATEVNSEWPLRTFTGEVR